MQYICIASAVHLYKYENDNTSYLCQGVWGKWGKGTVKCSCHHFPQQFWFFFQKKNVTNIVSFYVDSVSEWYEKLKDKVEVIQKTPDHTTLSRREFRVIKNMCLLF